MRRWRPRRNAVAADGSDLRRSGVRAGGYERRQRDFRRRPECRHCGTVATASVTDSQYALASNRDPVRPADGAANHDPDRVANRLAIAIADGVSKPIADGPADVVSDPPAKSVADRLAHRFADGTAYPVANVALDTNPNCVAFGDAHP